MRTGLVVQAENAASSAVTGLSELRFGIRRKVREDNFAEKFCCFGGTGQGILQFIGGVFILEDCKREQHFGIVFTFAFCK